MTGASDSTVVLGRFRYEGRDRVGSVNGDGIDLIEHDNLSQVIGQPGNFFAKTTRVAASDVTWLAPLEASARVFAVALNYWPHADETGQTPPERPLVFYKPPSAFVGQLGTLESHPEFTAKYDYEGEVGIVIGRRCSKATLENALSFVGGVCALMDGSARDRLKVQGGNIVFLDWLASKAVDGASLVGPAIACGPKVIKSLKDKSITVETRLNGEVVQQGNISEMVFSCEQLIVALSEFMTLLPGDIIATGTPGGIGQARGRFLTTGDTISVAISNLAPLEARIG